MPACAETLFCVGCDQEVSARLTSGQEVYPHRTDLENLPFWRCDGCGNFVGCHHKTNNPTRPLGCIPTPELKRARQAIHRELDPIWQGGTLSRKQVYREMAIKLGLQSYHTAEIRSLPEAEQAWAAACEINLEVKNHEMH